MRSNSNSNSEFNSKSKFEFRHKLELPFFLGEQRSSSGPNSNSELDLGPLLDFCQAAWNDAWDAGNLAGDAWEGAVYDAWGPAKHTTKRLPRSLRALANLCRSASRTLEPRVLGNARKPRSGTRWNFKQPAATILDRRAWEWGPHSPPPGFFSQTLLLQAAIRELV